MCSQPTQTLTRHSVHITNKHCLAKSDSPAVFAQNSRHVRLFTDYFESVQSGCEGLDCPCLDSPADAGVPCVRLGDRLADVPQGKSDFAQRCAPPKTPGHSHLVAYE
jgi:hypothetical protein